MVQPVFHTKKFKKLTIQIKGESSCTLDFFHFFVLKSSGLIRKYFDKAGCLKKHSLKHLQVGFFLNF